MGLTYANIDLQNGDDVGDFERGRIGEDEIHQINIHVLVDTGAISLCINEEIRKALGLRIIEHRTSYFADNRRVKLPVAGPVVVRFADRLSITTALVLPDDSEPLLGAIPLEDMDLYVHPGRNELAPMHPDGTLMSVR